MKLAVLDLDNTLLDRVSAFRMWAENFIRTNHLSDFDVSDLEDLDQDGLIGRIEFCENTAALIDGKITAKDIFQDYDFNYPECFVLDPDIKKSLIELRASGFAIGIATNGPPRQNVVIRKTGLHDCVDSWVVSEDVNVRKPNRKIVDLLIEGLNKPCEPVCVVGDSVVDIELAQNLGCSGVWLNRGRDWNLEEFSPSFFANNFTEGVDWVIENFNKAR